MTNIHRHDFVHLDLGNSGNILVRDGASPAIIDFASCTSTRHFPSRLRRALEKRDRLGLLKFWHRYSPETMPPVMVDYFNRHYHKHLAAGLGISIVPDTCKWFSPPGVRFIEMPELTQCDMSVSFAWNTHNQSPALQNFINTVLECSRDESVGS
ncbi:hypothetical protein [Oceanisphaera sp.]|uniref:hypothetical protein n=1 Tax=Oceanisphaera sp. TaxID=1929979 RepID=UPI003A8D7395